MANGSREAILLAPYDLNLNGMELYLPNGLFIRHSLSSSVLGEYLEKKARGLSRTTSSKNQARGGEMPDNFHLLW